MYNGYGEYECILIINPKINEIKFKEKLENAITYKLSYYEYLGVRKLAYNLRNCKDGKYIQFDFILFEKTFLEELEFKLKSWNEVLKFIIVKKEV